MRAFQPLARAVCRLRLHSRSEWAGWGGSKRSNSLDAVRGVAILLVVAFHWFRLPFGWTGVDLFFVLSGYLIGGILIDNRESDKYFEPFYARRAFRILPLYLIFLITIAAMGGLDLPLWRYLTFTQNFAWVQSGLLQAGLTGLTWSLAVEEQFYLVLPIIVRVFSDRVLLILCCCIIASGPFVRWFLVATVSTVSPYLLLPGRMDLLFTGVLVACLVRQPKMWKTLRCRKRTLIGVSASAFSGFLVLGVVKGFQPAAMPMYMVGYSLMAITFGCGLLAVVADEKNVDKQKVLGAIGVGAYSIYLFHQIVGLETARVVGLLGGGRIGLVVATLATAVIAIVCWVTIEKPLIRYAKKRWRYSLLGHLSPEVPPHKLALAQLEQIAHPSASTVWQRESQPAASV